tara:strand:+ start:1001 stop:1849 length:849 start_codon:yes stop_codon:yes gene_type:complete
MLAQQLEDFLGKELLPKLPSSIHHSDQTFNNISNISNYLHNCIGIFANNVHMKGLDIDNNLRIASTAVFQIEDKEFQGYCRFLADEIERKHSDLTSLDSSDIFLLKNVHHPGWNASIKYHTELKLLVKYDGILMSEMIDRHIGNIIRNFMGSYYRITDARPFITSLDINNGKNVNNKPHTDSGVPFTAKIIIYLSDVDVKSGPFCIVENGKIKPILGKCGTVIIFDNMKVEHCSLPIENNSRAALSLEMIPALTSEIIPCYNRPLNGIQLINPFINNPLIRQ